MEILKSHGLTDANLMKWFAIDPLQPATGDKDSAEGKRHAVIFRIRSRIQEGMARNFQSFREFYALDLAWDTPFRQISPTLLQTFMDTDPNDEAVYKNIQSWGLTNLIEEKTDPKTGKSVKTFNYPVFFNVVVPLVRSYVTIRWAKIMNDRRQQPFFKYDPIKLTAEYNARCEALTDRIEVMSNQYGYYDVMKQAVFKMLHYSRAFLFPKEEWHFEEQLKVADEEDVANEMTKADGTAASVGDEIMVTDREGLRYHIPHPTRVYLDLAHGPYTFNYDMGCEYCGYWRIARYREILNSTFWNKDRIALGNVDLINGNKLFFTTVYSASTLTIPLAPQTKVPEGPALMANLGLGAGNLDREKEIATLYYGTEHGDQGVFVTEHWEKLIPKDNGMGDYEQPVWFRFVVAGDQATVLYAAPVPYCPILYFGYDADESRSKNASLSMEIMPFQDQFSNVLSQILLTAKQNLANITFVDEDQITEDAKKKIQNIGEATYRFLNIFGYSGKKAFRGQNRVAEAVQSFNLPKGSTQELIQVLKNILDVLERVLVMSSQEAAQAATHELRVDEVRNINASTSSRLTFTTTPIDIATSAWKRQLYQGVMAYGDDDVWVHLPSEIPLTADRMKAMGFSFDTTQRNVHDRYHKVRANKLAIAVPLWSLASTRSDMDRADNAKVAQGIALIVQTLLGNPMTAAAIGQDQAIQLFNVICHYMGLPRDLKFRNVAPPPPSPEQQQQQQQMQAQGQLKQLVEAVLAQVGPVIQKDIQTGIKPLLDHVVAHDREFGIVFHALGMQVPPVANTALEPDDNNSRGPNGGNGGQANPRLAQPPGVPLVPGLPA